MLDFLQSAFVALRDREEGQAMVEYALILSLVSIAAIAVLVLLGPAVANALTTVTNAF